MTARCVSCATRGLQKCGCRRRTSPLVRAHLQRIAASASAKAAIVKRKQAVQRWKQIVQGCTVAEAWHKVYRLGYQNGRRTGYATGWSDCTKVWGNEKDFARSDHPSRTRSLTYASTDVPGVTTKADNRGNC